MTSSIGWTRQSTRSNEHIPSGTEIRLREHGTLRHTLIKQVPQIQGEAEGVSWMYADKEKIQDTQSRGTKQKGLSALRQGAEHNHVRFQENPPERKGILV